MNNKRDTKKSSRIAMGFFIEIFLVALPLQTASAFTTIGNPSCNDWQNNMNEEKKLPETPFRGIGALSSRAWLMGFVSGYNAADSTGKDLLGAIDAGTIYLWMDRYCKNNPKSSLAHGAQKLFEELIK